MTERTCNRCKRTLPLTAQYFSPKPNDKFVGWCRQCCNASYRAWYQRGKANAYKAEASKQAISEFVQAYKEGVK
jgi:hypothetical protein